MKEIKILLSAIGHSTSPGLIQAIKNNGEREVKVIGVDMDPTVIISSILDGYYQVPSYTDPNTSDPYYIDSILKICKKDNVDVYYAQQEEEGIFSSKRKQEFEDIGVKVKTAEKWIYQFRDKGFLLNPSKGHFKKSI